MARNRYDNFYGYTGLFPIRPSDGDGSAPARDLRRDLTELANGPGSMFSRTGLVHGARLFVLSDVVFNGHPSPIDHLRDQYLVLSVTFDGDLDPFLRRVYERSADEWARVFRHTQGYPDPLNPDGLISHVRACQITTSFLYVDAEADLDRTRLARAAQRELRKMVQAAQGQATGQRRILVKETLERLRALPPAIPGSMMQEGIARGTRSQ